MLFKLYIIKYMGAKPLKKSFTQITDYLFLLITVSSVYFHITCTYALQRGTLCNESLTTLTQAYLHIRI